MNTADSICNVDAGSTLGGCIAKCGGGSGICLEFPAASPPSKGPYQTTGAECTPDDSGGGTGGGAYNPVGPIVVGGERETDISGGFNSISANVVKAIDNFAYQSYRDNIESASDFDAMRSSLSKIEEYSLSNKSYNELTSLYSEQSNSRLSDINEGIYDLSGYMEGGLTESINANRYAVEDGNYLLGEVIDSINNLNLGGGGGGEGGGGTSPCDGPLCSFTPSIEPSKSGFDTIFDGDSLADIKKQVNDKNTEIQERMADIKKVFSGGDLTINGQYENNYQDVHGARVDLSGKSNMELFFNSGPKQAIWFLAVLIAFTVLMGGRKNA